MHGLQERPPPSRTVIIFINLLLSLLALRMLWNVDAFRDHVCRDIRVQPQVLDVISTGDGDAVAVWFDGRGGYWLDLLDEPSDVSWRRRIPGMAQRTLDHYSVMATARRVFVRYVAPTNEAVRVRAFARDDGTVLWDVPILAAEPSDGERTILVPFDLVATKMVVAVSLAHGRRAVVLDAVDGRLIATRDTAEAFEPPLIVGDRFVLSERGVSEQTASLEHVDIVSSRDGQVCRLGGSFATVRSASNLHIESASPPVVLQEVNGRIERCGEIDRQRVALVRAEPDEDLRAVVWDDTGALVREVRLGPGRVHALRNHRLRGRSPFDGAMTRFVPLLLEHVLVLVDLQEGRVVWRSRPSRGLASGAVFLSGSRWILHLRRSGLIASLDGTTGRLAAAIATGHDIADVTPANADDGRLWLRRIDSEPWARQLTALDLATLTSPDLAVRDVTEELRRELGIP